MNAPGTPVVQRTDDPRLSEREPRSWFALTCLGGLMVFAGFGLIMAALPALLVSQGWAPFTIGLIVGSHAVGAVVFRIIGFRCVDQLGPRIAARAGAIVGICACALLPLAIGMGEGAPAIAMLMAAKFGQGSAQACYVTAALTAAATSNGGAGDDARRIAVFSGVASLGLLVGPPLGLLLLREGWVGVLFALPALCYAGAILAVPIARGVRHFVPHDRAVMGRMPDGVRTQPIAIGVLCLAALLQGGAEAHLPAVATAFDATADLVALHITFDLAIVVAKVMCGRAYNRLGGRQTIALGLVLCAAALFLPIIVGNPITLVISGIGLGIGSGLVGTATVIAVSRASNEDERGAAIGVCALTQHVGLASGALIVGSKKRRGDKNA